MTNSNLDPVGVRAVFEGIRQYLQSAGAYETATKRAFTITGQAARSQKDVAAASSALNKNLQGSARTAASFAVGLVGAQSAIMAVRGGITGTVGAAISFEDTFAGIRKTVDATETEFGQLEKTNRQMAKSLPISVNEINKIGELGGALGVEGVSNIAKFERVVADLANTTDLTAESAATAIAKVSNIFELPIAQADRFGSALVDLGNKSAATESQIVDFTQRIGGAGRVAGLTVAQVAGIGAAFASSGSEAESGGTAIQKILISMTKAAATGGKELEVFAETAGLTVEEFRKLAKENPAEAFTRFVEGLKTAGDGAFQILEDLGEADARTIRAFLQVSQAGDLLRRSIETGTQAFRENNALQIEAEKRYATTASQLKILRNNLLDIGIDIGNVALPAINDFSGGVVSALDASRDFAGVFQSAGRAAIVFGIALAAIKLTQYIADARAAILVTGGLRTALNTPLGKAGLIAGVVLIGDLVSQAAFGQGLIDLLRTSDEDSKRAAKSMKVYDDALISLDNSIEALGEGPGLEDFLQRQTGTLESELTKIAKLREEVLGSGGDKVDRFFLKLDINDTIPIVSGLEDAISSKVGIDAQATEDELKQMEEDVKARVKAIVAALEGAEQPDIAFAAFAEFAKGLGPEFLAEIDKAIDGLNQRINGIDVQSLAQLGVALGLGIDAGASQAEQAFGALIESGISTTASMKAIGDQSGATGEDLTQMGDAAAESAEGVDQIADAVDVMKQAFEGLDSTGAVLEFQIAKLQQARAAAEGAGQSTEAYDKKIAILEATLEGANRETEIAAHQANLYAIALTETGTTADAAANIVLGLADTLSDLPPEVATDVRALLNSDDQAAILSFFALLRAGVEVPIALKLKGSIADIISKPFDPRDTSSKNRLLEATVDAKSLREQLGVVNALTAETEGLTGAYQGAGAAAGGAADKTDEFKDRLTQVMEAIGDGTISLQEAMALGLSDQEVVLLELEKARQAENDAAYRSRIEFQKLAKVLGDSGLSAEAFEFAMALRAIAEHLEETGQSINEFLHEVATDALDELRSRISGLFSQPTREGLELELQLRQKELERARRKRAGASDESLEALDKEIERIRDTIDIREKELDILRIKTQLEDQTLLTDKDLLTQNQLLTIALREQSEKVRDLNGVVFLETLARLQAIDATNRFAESMRNAVVQQGQAALESGQISNDEFFNEVLNDEERLRLAKLLEELHRQGKLHSGGITKKGGTFELAPEELVLPLNSPQAKRILATVPPGAPASSQSVVFAPTVNAPGGGTNETAIRAMLHRMVDDMFQSGRLRAERAGSRQTQAI